MNKEHLKMIAEMHSAKIHDLESRITQTTRNIAMIGCQLDTYIKQVDKLKVYLAEACMAIVESEKECDCKDEYEEKDE